MNKKHLILCSALSCFLTMSPLQAEEAQTDSSQQQISAGKQYKTSVHGDSNASQLLRAPVTFANGNQPLREFSNSPSDKAPLANLKARLKEKKPLINLPGNTGTPSESSKPEEQGDWLNFLEVVLNVDDVKPWQKGTLAKSELKPGGDVPVFDKIAQKVFLSKESTRGGYGVAGGGCGCN